jgi:hypothetical protein
MPKARKSTRELFRVLGNAHYKHLAELLAALDACAGVGFRQPELLRTRGRRPFTEGVAEVAVADHLRRLGFAVSGFGDLRANDPVPDVRAVKGQLTLAAEVYCPRAWPNLDSYTQGLTDRVNHLDRAVDYEFHIEHTQLEQFGRGHRLLYLHPEVLDEGLDEPTRLSALKGLIAQLEGALGSSSDPVAEVELAALNLMTTVELESVTTTSATLPARGRAISGPPLSAYRPQAMFERNVRGVVSKMKKGQALSARDAVPVLVVEMSQSELTSELVETSYYRPHFVETLEGEVRDLAGYGAVVFVEFSDWQRALRVHFMIVEDTIIDAKTLESAFPSEPGI